MEKMRVGQGVSEGIHLLKSELSGNNFSWNAAQVPGDVYTDLFLAGELDDPFWGRNMGKAKWVQEYEWWYNRAFNVDKNLIGKDIELIFEGVDFSCEVWLNQKYLGRHEGMYSSFSFQVTDLLDYSQPHVPVNLLTVKLDPPPKNQQNFAGMKHNFSGDYLTGLIGPEFMEDASHLEKLLAYKDDENVLADLRTIKKEAKAELKKYLMQTQGVEIDENSIFDIQIKRLHEYKRQQMNALYAIYKYKEIKKGNLPKRPITMIFGAKAAPAYTIAKDIIHLLLCLQKLIENDPAVRPYLRIVMVEKLQCHQGGKS